jgi:hypothetical protein
VLVKVNATAPGGSSDDMLIGAQPRESPGFYVRAIIRKPIHPLARRSTHWRMSRRGLPRRRFAFVTSCSDRGAFQGGLTMLVRSQALSRLSCRGFLSALVIALAVVPLWSQAISEPDAEGAAGSPAGPAAEPAFEPAIEGEIDTPVGPGYGPRRTIRPGMSGFKPLGSRLAPTAEAEPFNTEALRARPGSTFVVKNVTGSTQGSVWGSGVYTDDSDVASAAVHAGALKEGETRDVRVVALGPRDAFDGSTHNGVTSSQYGA